MALRSSAVHARGPRVASACHAPPPHPSASQHQHHRGQHAQVGDETGASFALCLRLWIAWRVNMYLRSAFFHRIDRSCRCCFLIASCAGRSTTGNVSSVGRRRHSYHRSCARSPFDRSFGKSMSRIGGRSSAQSPVVNHAGHASRAEASEDERCVHE